MSRQALDVRWTDVGRPVRSLVAGVPTGLPDLVVVPGLGALGYLLPLVRACSAQRRVHLLDLPGFGHRATARLPTDLASVAATASGWLDRHAAPVLLLGHSTGAQVALRVRSPHVASLALAGPTFPPEARRLLPLLLRVLRTLPHECPGELPAVLPDYLRGARRLPELLASALADDPAPGRADLVLRGRHDHLSPQAWAEHLGPVTVVPGGHNSVFTHPLEHAVALLR